jgi:hypothetical protein
MDNNREIADCAITTIDNPFDPFTEFDKWFAYDESHGYGSCSYLAKIMKSSDAFSIEDQIKEKERAIDEIVALNINGMYKKVVRYD